MSTMKQPSHYLPIRNQGTRMFHCGRGVFPQQCPSSCSRCCPMCCWRASPWRSWRRLGSCPGRGKKTGQVSVQFALLSSLLFLALLETLSSLSFLLTQLHLIYCIRHNISRGFIFANFVIRVLFAILTTHKNIYLQSRRMNATYVRNAIVVQYTVHSARARQDR